MEIKFKNNPVTIKTVEIGGKKLTKQFVKQIPRDYFIYHFDEKNNKHFGVMLDEDKDIINNYSFDGEIIGWLNIWVDDYNDCQRYIYNSNHNINTNYFKTILYININGELRKSYLDLNAKSVIKKEIEQIYI